MDEDQDNFVEDDGSDDDKFEETWKKQYEQQMIPKKQDKRPESKHGRPESSKFTQKKQSLNDNTIPISVALQKFNQLVTYNNIKIEHFWKSDSVNASPEEFVSFLGQAGFTFTQEEINQVLSDLENEFGKITIENICKKVQAWNSNENTMLEFIKEKALHMAQASKRKFSAQKKSKPQSASATRTAPKDFRPISGISYKSKQSGFTEFKIGEERPVQNLSKYYLQKAKEREKEMDRLLQLTISKGKNEYEYEMLIKMGEANELSQLLESKITYRAYKSAQGNLKVHMYELDRFNKDMTLEEFQREYNMIKNKYNEGRNLKIWEVLSENKKSQKSLQHFGTQKDEIQQDSQNQHQSKIINKKERQSELKKVLLETMMLTNVLKEQLSVLQKKGIVIQQPSM
ncbi:unnamed protein product [Paramecium pentaurelia]|uniref:Uncharacterized protein n=1 Tax=Paramecium pentaurelia TaxID=43138 RepID=A0A8S1WTX5_9CILI|nr:unnamed protein product [Paramecium pentaurelia]